MTFCRLLVPSDKENLGNMWKYSNNVLYHKVYENNMDEDSFISKRHDAIDRTLNGKMVAMFRARNSIRSSSNKEHFCMVGKRFLLEKYVANCYEIMSFSCFPSAR